jgi:S-adenosylmethionine:tRNA ribosyltransferase-isomerase
MLGEVIIPDYAVAHEPPEARGLGRDAVRLMISRAHDDSIAHARFSDLPRFLTRGDLILVNASATIQAALRATRRRRGGERESVLLHLSSPADSSPIDAVGAFERADVERWIVELRRRTTDGHRPLLDADPGERIELPGGTATLVEPFGAERAQVDRGPGFGTTRLWIAELALAESVLAYAARHGEPIRYAYVPRPWPLPYYQTIFARQPGSAEMPSAARPFTRAVLQRLGGAGVEVAEVVLHTGVSSQDAGEPPYPERFRVPAETAAAVNRTRAAGGRIVAVGTTVVRALESVASADSRVHAAEGWTDLVVTAERGVRVVDGLVTGLHAPEASHLEMLEAFADSTHLRAAYQAALSRGYLWHEFGDSHLLLP